MNSFCTQMALDFAPSSITSYDVGLEGGNEACGQTNLMFHLYVGKCSSSQKGAIKETAWTHVCVKEILLKVK